MNQEVQEQFKKEITRCVDENVVTIVNNATNSQEIPIYLAQAGYKVIVAGSEKNFNAYERFMEISQKFDKEVAYSNGLPYISNNYHIIFITYNAELIRQILNNKDSNTVLIVEDSYNCTTADLLLSFCKQLQSKGAKLKLVIINKILKYNSKLSDFFDGAPIIKKPTKSYYVSFTQVPANDIEKIILDSIQHGTYKNFLVLLPEQDEINKLSKKLHESFEKYGINTEILTLYSSLSFEDQKSCISNHFSSRIILSTNLFQNCSITFDVDVVIDTGLEKVAKTINGVKTLTLKNISKFDISQRQALAGKYSPGIYYLCSDFDYNSRKEVRLEVDESLDIILLTLINNNFNISSFKFLSGKSKYYISSSLQLLQMLGAINDEKITEIGRKMCKIPLEVRFSRILVEAKSYDVEFDALASCLLLKFGPIINTPIDCFKHDLKSDLFGQLLTLKKLYFGHKIPNYAKIRQSDYSKTANLLKKLSCALGFTPSVNTDTSVLKKCIACGLPDFLFIAKRNVGYRNDSSSSPRYLFKDSSIPVGKNRFIVGIPVNFFNSSDNTSFNRIVVPTVYSLEDVITCYSKWFKSTYSISGNNIFQNQTYNGIVITSQFIGTIEELKMSNPDDFHEEEEVDQESGKIFICLYFHNLKVDSREKIKII